MRAELPPARSRRRFRGWCYIIATSGRVFAMRTVILSDNEVRVLLETLEAAYRRQQREAAEVLASGEERFHQEVTDRLCILDDVLHKLGSSGEIAVANDPVVTILKQTGLSS
jgi:hypothetical protein